MAEKSLKINRRPGRESPKTFGGNRGGSERLGEFRYE